MRFRSIALVLATPFTLSPANLSPVRSSPNTAPHQSPAAGRAQASRPAPARQAADQSYSTCNEGCDG